MKRFLTSLAILSSFLMIFSSISCKSSKPVEDSQPVEKTTFVETEISEDGKLYSTCIFERLTDVTFTDYSDGKSYPVPLENVAFNKKTGELSARNLPDSIASKIEESKKAKSGTFHIEGVPVRPARFVLYLMTNSEPLVLLNGKKLEPSEYKWSKGSNSLEMPSSFDHDEDSYKIVWISGEGYNSLGNKTEDFETEYKRLTDEWLFAQRSEK